MSFEMWKSDPSDKVADEFLNSQTKKGTFTTYKVQLKAYLKWASKSGQELINIKKEDKDFAVVKSLFLQVTLTNFTVKIAGQLTERNG